MKFCVVNLGCKVNRVESDMFAASFGALGWESAAATEADVIIVNTCTVTGEAEKKTRKAIRKVLRENPNAQVCATGCAITISPEAYQALDERLLVEPDKSRVVERVSSCASVVPESRAGKGYPTRVGIKIQDGCDHACTFCIVHTARGKSWSRPYEEIVLEAKEYSQAGVKELVLTGINIGSYNSGEHDLVSLLTELLACTEDTRFRISSIEPIDVSDSLIDLIAQAQGRICRHLHLPLQSGSDKVLKEMARPYRVSFYQDLVARIYRAMPGFSLSTDIIVGFPGETEEDFFETLAFAKECRFSKIHVFPYSQRMGTPAAARSDQVVPPIKKQRVQQLTELATQLRTQDRAQRSGTTELVLVESQGIAMSESYHEIDLQDSSQYDALSGEMIPFIF